MVQIRKKIKNLRAEYNKVTRNNSTSGAAFKSMKYYMELDELFRHRPVIEFALNNGVDVGTDLKGATLF